MGSSKDDAKVYTGVGSRDTPDETQSLIRAIADLLARKDWVVRSGGAPGADTAFIDGAWAMGYASAEVYLPWPGFEGYTEIQEFTRDTPQEEAFEIAAKHHPGWSRLSRGGRLLHARNVHQVLGYDVTKPALSRFVLCYTKNGKGGGGTGQAIRIAKHYDVPVYDLGNKNTHDLFNDLID